MLKKTGEGMYANTSNKIIEKLQNKPSRWKVFDPEEEGSDVDSEGNIKV